MSTVKEILKYDLYRYTGQRDYSMLRGWLEYPGFRYTYIWRKCQEYRGGNRWAPWFLFWKWMLKKYTLKYGYEMSFTTEIGPGFYIGHLGGVAIHPDSVIGKNFTITKGVTVGQVNRGSKKGAPTIGDNVFIGVNAMVAGKVHIGDNVLVAAGAFCNFDVPSNSIVLGNPGKIIAEPEATKGYINNVLE